MIRAASLATFGALFVGAEAPPLHEERPATAAEMRAVTPLKADADGDRVFDDLEARLRRLAPADKQDVIVTLDAGASSERSRGSSVASAGSRSGSASPSSTASPRP